jgi:multiple sugar transport system permease protein
MNPRRFRQTISSLQYLARAVYLFVALFPLYWVLKISLTSTKLLFKESSNLFPSRITLEQFASLFASTPFLGFFKNSLIVSSATGIIATVLAAGCGFALSRFVFRGQGMMRGVLLATQIFPLVLLITPLYKLFIALHLVDTLQGLVLIYVVFNLPFAIFLMQGFFDGIPVELEEAALIDGCSRFQALWRVVLPLTRPGLVATLGFVFTGAWSELLFGLMLINSDTNKTVAVGLLSFVGKFGVDWGQITAAAVLSLLPVLLFFGLIQRYLVSGLTAGAVKG